MNIYGHKTQLQRTRRYWELVCWGTLHVSITFRHEHSSTLFFAFCVKPMKRTGYVKKKTKKENPQLMWNITSDFAHKRSGSMASTEEQQYTHGLPTVRVFTVKHPKNIFMAGQKKREKNYRKRHNLILSWGVSVITCTMYTNYGLGARINVTS